MIDALMGALTPVQLQRHVRFAAPTALMEAANEADCALFQLMEWLWNWMYIYLQWTL